MPFERYFYSRSALSKAPADGFKLDIAFHIQEVVFQLDIVAADIDAVEARDDLAR